MTGCQDESLPVSRATLILIMRNTNRWAQLSLLNLSIVAFLGVILRSKILFSIPWVNYLHWLDGHFHFAFQGWMTLALLVIFRSEILSEKFGTSAIYDKLFAGVLLGSWAILLATILDLNNYFKEIGSWLFILLTFLFSGVFLRDLRLTPLDRSVRLLSFSAMMCLLLSAVGPILLAYFHSTNDYHPLLDRDALYLYLHFQYNGFFTLAVLAILCQKLCQETSAKHKKKFLWFAITSCAAVLPSLFLSFLWQDPNSLFRIIAGMGSALLLISAFLFISVWGPVARSIARHPPLIKWVYFISVSAFVLKNVLQGLTIFKPVGDAVFGDRPIIIGFLHLVFLAFVTPFVLGTYLEDRIINRTPKFARFAVGIFMFGVLFNEFILMFQGLGTMLLKSSFLFPWFLWFASILLLVGSVLLLVASVKSNAGPVESG